MRFRNLAAGPGRVDLQMAPMIDVVFQLLIFFMLTLRVIPPEGEFHINMPAAPGPVPIGDELLIPDIKIRLAADPEGNLSSIAVGQRSLGTDMAALGRQVLSLIGGRPGGPLSRELEVEIDADYHLHYQHVVDAISACTGRYDPETGQIIKYVEKIKFAPPRIPAGS